jgi:hypothetical protein
VLERDLRFFDAVIDTRVERRLDVGVVGNAAKPVGEAPDVVALDAVEPAQSDPQSGCSTRTPSPTPFAVATGASADS